VTNDLLLYYFAFYGIMSSTIKGDFGKTECLLKGKTENEENIKIFFRGSQLNSCCSNALHKLCSVCGKRQYCYYGRRKPLG
jgi:hypothetical protein